MLLSPYLLGWFVLVRVANGGVLESTHMLLSTDPTPTLQISSDGTCGQGLTCLGSRYGSCCSEHFFCGNGDTYCGANCHSSFGACSDSGSSTPLPANTDCTVMSTETTTSIYTSTFSSTEVYTYVIKTTSVETVQVTATATNTLTQTVKTTATNTVTQTVRSTATDTLTETVKATATDTVTQTVKATVTILTTNTILISKTLSAPLLTSTVLVTKTTTAPLGSLTTYSSGSKPSASPSDRTTSVVAPSQTFSGTPTNCKKWYQLKADDDCQYVAAITGLNLQKLLSLNPLLVSNPPPSMTICDNLRELQRGSCRVDCVSMFAGYSLCVGL